MTARWTRALGAHLLEVEAVLAVRSTSWIALKERKLKYNMEGFNEMIKKIMQALQIVSMCYVPMLRHVSFQSAICFIMHNWSNLTKSKFRNFVPSVRAYSQYNMLVLSMKHPRTQVVDKETRSTHNGLYKLQQILSSTSKRLTWVMDCWNNMQLCKNFWEKRLLDMASKHQNQKVLGYSVFGSKIQYICWMHFIWKMGHMRGSGES